MGATTNTHKERNGFYLSESAKIKWTKSFNNKIAVGVRNIMHFKYSDPQYVFTTYCLFESNVWCWIFLVNFLKVIAFMVFNKANCFSWDSIEPFVLIEIHNLWNLKSAHFPNNWCFFVYVWKYSLPLLTIPFFNLKILPLLICFVQKLTDSFASWRSQFTALVAILFIHIPWTFAAIARTMFRYITFIARVTANNATFTKLKKSQRKTKMKSTKRSMCASNTSFQKNTVKKNSLCNYHSTFRSHIQLRILVYMLYYRNMDHLSILRSCHNRILRRLQRFYYRNFDAQSNQPSFV